jgi:hypothetical protein
MPKQKVDYVGIPWIGVDLDGTLAEYSTWKGEEHIGEPIHAMIAKVKTWQQSGRVVKIFTARAAHGDKAIEYVKLWALKHGLGEIEITCVKDYSMIELWDDRAQQVHPNSGQHICFFCKDKE